MSMFFNYFKLRKEEMDRMKRQEDEEELQKMKAKQREKVNKERKINT